MESALSKILPVCWQMKTQNETGGGAEGLHVLKRGGGVNKLDSHNSNFCAVLIFAVLIFCSGVYLRLPGQP